MPRVRSSKSSPIDGIPIRHCLPNAVSGGGVFGSVDDRCRNSGSMALPSFVLLFAREDALEIVCLQRCGWHRRTTCRGRRASGDGGNDRRPACRCRPRGEGYSQDSSEIREKIGSGCIQGGEALRGGNGEDASLREGSGKFGSGKPPPEPILWGVRSTKPSELTPASRGVSPDFPKPSSFYSFTKKGLSAKSSWDWAGV